MRMKYSLVISLMLAAVQVTAKPQDAPEGSAKSGCTLNEVLIARGTSESGPYGFIVGDPLVAELKRRMPGVKTYAYPANLNQGPGTNQGANDVVKRVTSQLAACASAKFALVGYSQGARVVRIGATKLTPAQQARVVAAVVYGDAGDKPGPRNAAKFPPDILAKLKDNCVKGDPNCNESGNVSNHLKYNTGTYHKDSATFIIAGFKGEPLPITNSAPWVVSGGAKSTGQAGKGKSAGAPKEPSAGGPKEPSAGGPEEPSDR